MEIASFPLLRCHYYQHNLKRRHSCSICRSFVQQRRGTQQRLIPLTEEIVKAMADFNVSPSDTSLPEKQLYSTLSITSLVREEVQNILHAISISERFIRMEEIDKLIEKCIQEKANIMRENSVKANGGDAEEVTEKEFSHNKCTSSFPADSLQVLEQRITNLEKRLSFMIQTSPMLDTKKLKINTKVLTDNIRRLGENQEKANDTKEIEPTSAQTQKSTRVEELSANEQNAYDDKLFYEIRENILNLINFKKSVTTLQLNEKVQFNPNVKPIISTLPEPRHRLKQVTTFIINHF